MRKIRDFATVLCAGLGLAIVGSGSAQAVPFEFEFNDTIVLSFFPGLSVGDAAKITVTLDNGNATNISQTWTASDAVSVEFDFNNGGLVTTFSAPFDGGLAIDSGDFVTDGSGTLTSVMNGWSDLSVDADFTTNGSGTDFIWFFDGANYSYGEGTSESVIFGDVSEIRNPGAWTQVSTNQPSTSVSEPGTLALFGLSLVGLVVMRRRKRLV